ncbi:Cyclic di-GMP phosphodiesterase response regulator RpfG [compost metagenome]
MAVADVYDALTSKRVYKEAFSHDESVEIILNDSGIHFDPGVVEAFIQLKDKFKAIAESCRD